MIRELLNIFAPPIETDFYRERLRHNLDAVLVILIVSFALAFVVNEAPQSRIGTGIMAVCLLFVRRFLTRGNMTFARIASPLIGYISLSYLIFTGFGIHSVTVPALCVLIICARALGTGMSATIYLLLCMSTLGVAYYLGKLGLIAVPSLVVASPVDLLNLYITLVATTAAVWFLAKNIEDDRDIAYAAVRDSDEKQAALVDKERQYRLLADNVHDFIWTADLEYRYTYCSPSCERILGYKPAELFGTSIFSQLPPSPSGDSLEERLQQELGVGSATPDSTRTKIAEVEFRRKDGSVGFVETHISIMLDDNGEPIGIIGMSRDITEKVLAQNKARDVSDQLRHAQKIDSIGQLAGGIAHDFSNVLVAVQGYSDLITRHESVPMDARRYAAEIKKAAVRAETWTRQLLTFSRRQAMESKPVALNDVVLELRDMLSHLIPATINVSFNLVPDIDEILGDSSQLGQLIINLCVNARDAMSDGGSLSLETRNIELSGAEAERFPNVLPGRYVQLCVTDTGVGMSAEVRSRIFEPFFTTKRTGHGTGLGLSVVHGIVVEHGGFIDVQSNPGFGTSIYVNFPKSDLAAPTRTLIPMEESLPGGNETILVVEDEEQLRDLATLVLSQAGYTVLTAADGLLGWELFLSQKDNISLAISDVVMPNLGGRQLLKLIREVDDTMPFMFTSGYVGGPDPLNFQNQYGVEFLPKPFSGAMLQRRVRDILDSSKRPAHQRRVLAIDDNAANLNLLRLDIEELGHLVKTAGGGNDAIELCKQQRFDLVFVDLQMQPMNGIETAIALRSQLGDGVDIIGLTAHVTEQEKQACLNAGMQDVITKPLRYDALTRLLGGKWAEKTPQEVAGAQCHPATIFDVDVSLHLANNRPKEAQELLDILMRELPHDQQAINNAYDRHDTDALKREVHKLNGAVKYCGVPALANVVKRLETAAKADEGAGVAAGVKALNDGIDELFAWYRANPRPFVQDMSGGTRPTPAG